MANFMDCFSREDRTEVTFSTFYTIMRECAKAEMLENAARAGVPNEYIIMMLDGVPGVDKMPTMMPGVQDRMGIKEV